MKKSLRLLLSLLALTSFQAMAENLACELSVGSRVIDEDGFYTTKQNILMTQDLGNSQSAEIKVNNGTLKSIRVVRMGSDEIRMIISRVNGERSVVATFVDSNASKIYLTSSLDKFKMPTSDEEYDESLLLGSNSLVTLDCKKTSK